MTSENILPLIKLLIPAYLSIFQLSLIEAGLIVLSGSVIFSLATVISMILGLGQLLLQFGKGFRTLPVLSVMNAFSSSHVSVYPKIGTGLLIQCGWCIGILIAGFHLLKEKSVR